MSASRRARHPELFRELGYPHLTLIRHAAECYRLDSLDTDVGAPSDAFMRARYRNDANRLDQGVPQPVERFGSPTAN